MPSGESVFWQLSGEAPTSPSEEILELHEGEVGAGGVGLAQPLAGHLVVRGLGCHQVIEIGHAELGLSEVGAAGRGGAGLVSRAR